MTRLVVFILLLLVPCAAWAEAWVMVCPPWPPEEGAAKLPLAQWTQIAAYDTAAACEIQRRQFIDDIPKEQTERGKDFWATSVAYYMVCRCMPYEFWWRSQQPSR